MPPTSGLAPASSIAPPASGEPRNVSRNLVDRSYSLYCLQRHLTLEGRLILLPWLSHQFLLSRHRFYILFNCLVFGEYLIPTPHEGAGAVMSGYAEITVVGLMVFD